MSAMKKSIFLLFIIAKCYILLAQEVKELKRDTLKYNKNDTYEVDIITQADFKKSDKCELRQLRHSSLQSRDFERIVFDFNEFNFPQKVYVLNSSKFKRVFIDFSGCETQLEELKIKGSKIIIGSSFYELGKGNLSIELELNKMKKSEIFYLKNPSRLVIDIKK